MTASIQSIGTDPGGGAARPAGLRATALRRLRRDPADLADRVIPVRLGWLREHAATLNWLIEELEGRWTADGRMADGALQAGDR